MKRNIHVVGIGASAGGLRALKEFFLNLPGSTGACYCVVTHLLRNHESILHKLLSKYTTMEVRRMTGHDPVLPDTVYVMPEGSKAYLKDGLLILRQRKDDEVVNKTIDEFFYSLAEEARERSVAIILSGMGSDGSKAIESIHAYGGTVMVQDPHSTSFTSMPETVIKRDHPDQVLPPALLAKTLVDVFRQGQSEEISVK